MLRNYMKIKYFLYFCHVSNAWHRQLFILEICVRSRGLKLVALFYISMKLFYLRIVLIPAIWLGSNKPPILYRVIEKC